MCLRNKLGLQRLIRFSIIFVSSVFTQFPIICQTLPQKDCASHKIPRKESSRRQTCADSLYGMCIKILALPVKGAKEIVHTSLEAFRKKGCNPVRKKQRMEILCTKIMFNHGVTAKRHAHYRTGTDKANPYFPLPTSISNPKKCRQKQKQQHVRAHQCKQRCYSKHGSQLASLSLLFITDCQSIKHNQMADTDNFRHSGKHISYKGRIKTKQKCYKPQLLPCGLGKPNKQKYCQCHQ